MRNFSSLVSISIKKLAAYCLDYARLITNSSLSRSVKTPELLGDVVNTNDLIFKDTDDTIRLNLITSLEHDVNKLDDEKTQEEKKAEQKLARDKAILVKINEIITKIKTQEYTKQIVLQTGFISFKAKKIKNNFFHKETTVSSEEPENYTGALLQIPVNVEVRTLRNDVLVTLKLNDDAMRVLIDPLKNYMPQKDFDDIFSLVVEAETESKNVLPIREEFLDELWSRIVYHLKLNDAENITQKPKFNKSVISLIGKANYFLAEDLDLITLMDDEELNKSSLGSWLCDDDMNIEKTVTDNGSTEIFFPFTYDKYQLKVLGITDNKAVIIEGPPGTGKSQTIANLLVHFAATGKKVLFVSQKDQAIRGVKNKLKSLDIPFLFGYIPDRYSRLHTEDDERDSAANTLMSINKQFQKAKFGDQKEPLSLLASHEQTFNSSLESERRLFTLYNEQRTMDYLRLFYEKSIDKNWWDIFAKITAEINELGDRTKQFANDNEQLIKAFSAKLIDLDIDIEATYCCIKQVEKLFKQIERERVGFFSRKIINIKLRKMLRVYAKDVIQEIYELVEKEVISTKTKSSRLVQLNLMKEYFAYEIDIKKLKDLSKQYAEAICCKGLDANLVKVIVDTIDKHTAKNIFVRLDRYCEIHNEITNMEKFCANKLNCEIKDIQKYYKSNVANYVRNRILAKVDMLNANKNTKAILARVAKSLSKSKKAYKTFDKLKNGDNGIANFETMSTILPIWMMSLDDVNRIIPMKMNCFDCVIIDEASQCNMAYALPTMFRAKHAIFFGDSLQMRDTNTLFKSNEQLSAIAKKHQIDDAYQIKADEDTVKSVMDIASLAGFKTAVLQYHYRSPKELIDFSNEQFYQKIGRSLEVVNDNILTYKDTGRVLLTHVVSPDANEEMSDKTNYAEVKKIKELIGEIKSDPKLCDKSIAVLAFFNEQVELLRREIDDDNIKVSIIEGIQGDERDIVIYSFVIKDPNDGKKRYTALTGEGGILRRGVNEGRINVAFSRARMQVHCVTSIEPKLWPEGIWIKQYLDYVDAHGLVKTRRSTSDQQFDSHFEEEVFVYLVSQLSVKEYILDTQVRSCGFKIDLVVYNKETGKKLAIECDGPTHFEQGDGQVYVKTDWERQRVLEIAGWNFYRISYFDWNEDRGEEQDSLLKFITNYFENKQRNIKTKLVKELEKKGQLPQDIPKEQFRTEILDAGIVKSVERTANDGEQPGITGLSKQSALTVSTGGINQVDFGQYLQSHVGKTIKIRYQSMRAGSARHFRELTLISFNDKYFRAISPSYDQPAQYLRERVVEFG
jgi:very-short-patch-repair endonuclease